jgi:hypothetical protein
MLLLLNAYMNEKVWTRAGPEVCPSLNGKALVIVKELYGMPPSTEHWRANFAETLHSLGISSSWGYQDVWLCLREDEAGYHYNCTHVDDVTITTKEPFQCMGEILPRAHRSNSSLAMSLSDLCAFQCTHGACKMASKVHDMSTTNHISLMSSMLMTCHALLKPPS